MRTILFALICFSFAACSQNEYEVEDEIYACLTQKAEKNRINLNSRLDKVEKALINEGILPNKSGEGKIEFYKSLKENGTFPTVSRGYQPDTALYALQHWLIDSVCNKNSAATKLTTIRDRTTQLLKEEGHFSPSSIADLILDEMNSADFDHPYYRAYFLLSVNFILEKETAYIRNIPKKLEAPDPPSNIAPEDIFKIVADENNNLYLNGEEIEIKNLEDLLVPFIMEISSDNMKHIRIEVTPKTEYRLFAKIHSAIAAARLTVLEHFSQKKYGKSFENLTEEEQKTLKKEHPDRVIEVRPQ